MANSNHYTGGCHCGAVRYAVEMPLENVMECNCSICSKKGTLLAFPAIENFKLNKGEDMLSEYQFNKHVIHHLFCKKCGVQSFARATTPDGKPGIAINVRCLDNVDLTTIPVMHYDGKSL